MLVPIEYFEIPFSECIQTNRAMILSGLLLAGSKLHSIFLQSVLLYNHAANVRNKSFAESTVMITNAV